MLLFIVCVKIEEHTVAQNACRFSQAAYPEIHYFASLFYLILFYRHKLFLTPLIDEFNINKEYIKAASKQKRTD